MKKKTILGLLAVMVTAFTINFAKAQTESGGGQFSCRNETDEICVRIQNADGTVTTRKGTAWITN